MEVKWWALEHQATLVDSRSTDALWDTGRQTLTQWLGADPKSVCVCVVLEKPTLWGQNVPELF